MNTVRPVLDESPPAPLPPIDHRKACSIRRRTTDATAAEALLHRGNGDREAANRARSAFLAEISHEIRTPLNVLLGMLEMTLKTRLDAEQREYLTLMKSAGESLSALVSNILDFSRIEADRLDIEQVPFSLHDTVGEALRLLLFEAGKKNLGLACEIAPEVPDTLLGDPLRLRQILVNLVGNAVKFSERGTITVRVEVEAGGDRQICCHFSVSDNGIGIPPEIQARIFKPYRQAESSTPRQHGGSGLGLHISARLVDLMQGGIWVDSTPGRGSIFHFTACFGRTEARTAHAEAPPRALAILLVEDNPLNRRLARLTLEKAGHRVLLAATGAAARRLLRHWRPDLILMDVQMPDVDGIQVTAAIRQGEADRGEHVPIIACSAHLEPEDRARCLRAGMDGYLSKPLEPTALLAVVDRLRRPGAAPLPTPVADRVLDRRTLLQQVNGDMRLLAEIREIFLRDSRRLMTEARRALARRDGETLAATLHTLRGMFRSLAADAAQDAAGHLEELAAQGEVTLAGKAYTGLVRELRALKAALRQLTRQGSPPHPLAAGAGPTACAACTESRK